MKSFERVEGRDNGFNRDVGGKEGMGGFKNRLPRGYVWGMQMVRKIRMRRARDRMIMGMRYLAGEGR